MNIIGKRYWFFGLSLAVIIPGLIALALGGLKPSIDFTGGTVLEYQFSSGTAPAPDQVRAALSTVTIDSTGQGLGAIQVQTSGTDGVILHLQQVDQATITKI